MLSGGLGLETSISFLPYSFGQAVTEPDMIQMKRLWSPLLGRVSEKCATILTPPQQGKAARGSQKGAKGSEVVTCHMGTPSRSPWLDTFLSFWGTSLPIYVLKVVSGKRTPREMHRM